MTAPSAPIIYGRFDGGKVRCRWQGVDDATDYKVYVGGTTAPTGLEADVPDDDVGADGWFFVTIVADEVPFYVAVTALNVGAEESDPSNELRVMSWGPGHF